MKENKEQTTLPLSSAYGVAAGEPKGRGELGGAERAGAGRDELW